MTHPTRPTRVAIVIPVLVRYDAIAAAAYDTFRVLSQHPDFDVSVLTFRNDYDDVPARTVSGLADLLLDSAFQAADIIIYHFGIYCELFDALIAAKGRARQFVRFHNITPPQFVAPVQRPVIERSFLQVHNLEHADEIWADSPVNAETLERLGISPTRIQVIPLAVENPTPRTLCGKARMPLNLLFVGRFVQSKGVLDLVEAVDLVRSRCSVPFRLRLAGNLDWSDPAYFTKVKDAVTARKLDMMVEILGTVNAGVLEDLYHMSHVFAIPSYHEGFCKPAIEALRAGCIPIGYASSNLPAISNGLGRMVPTGDTHALAVAIAEVMEGVAQSFAEPEEPLLPLDRGRTSACAFDRAVAEYVRTFTLDHLASATLDRIRADGRMAETLNKGSTTEEKALPYSHTNFPELAHTHIKDAKLFANRRDMVASLGIAQGGVVAEVGVAHGEFSEYLLQTLRPERFVAIDLFDMHKHPVIWGIPSEVMFDGMTQLDFYRRRFRDYGRRIVIEQGLSHEILARYPDQTFDMIYIDAGHDYESVKLDGEAAKRKIKLDGTIVFNDYVLYDPFGDGAYGVVQAVNEIVVAGGWYVVGFALEKNMFCDIALKHI